MEAIETLYSDRLAGQIESLAHHAFQGKVWEKAVVYLKQAGTKDLAHSAYREAATCFERALEALRPMPDTHQKVEHAIDFRLDLRQSLFPMGAFETIWEYLQEAEGLAETLDDPRRLGWVLAYMCGHLVHTGGHVSKVRDLALRVKTIAERLGDDQLLVASQSYLAAAYRLSGNYRGTEKVCRKLIAFLKDQQLREQSGLIVSPAVWSRAKLARVLVERGMFEKGETHGQEAIRIAESLDHPLSILVGNLFLAYLKSIRGELSQAEHLLERALDQCREWDFTSHNPIVMASLEHVYALSGRVQKGVSCLREALAEYERAGIGYYHSLSMKQFGEAYLLADQIENAHDCANRAVMLARERGERGYEAWSLHLLGEIASHHDCLDATAAENYYAAAITLTTELKMRPLLAHCNFGLGKLNRRTGKNKQAQNYLTKAIAMYDRMGMRFWLEKGESERKRLD